MFYGMLLAQNTIRAGLKTKVESVMESDKASEEVKAACKEWLDTYSCGATNGTATDNLVKALEGCDCEVCKDIVNNKTSWPRNPSGYLVVTDGLTISDLAALTTCLQAARTSRNGIRY